MLVLRWSRLQKTQGHVFGYLFGGVKHQGNSAPTNLPQGSFGTRFLIGRGWRKFGEYDLFDGPRGMVPFWCWTGWDCEGIWANQLSL